MCRDVIHAVKSHAGKNKKHVSIVARLDVSRELVPRFKRLLADLARPLHRRGDKEASSDVYCWLLGTKSNRQTCRSNSELLARATSPSKRSAEVEARGEWEVTRCYGPYMLFFRWWIKQKRLFCLKLPPFLIIQSSTKIAKLFFFKIQWLRLVHHFMENKGLFFLAHRLAGKLEILSIQSYEYQSFKFWPTHYDQFHYFTGQKYFLLPFSVYFSSDHFSLCVIVEFQTVGMTRFRAGRFRHLT